MSIYNEITPELLLDDMIEKFIKLISIPYRTKTKRAENERTRCIQNHLLIIRALRLAGIQPSERNQRTIQILDRNVNHAEVIYNILSSQIN